MINQRNPRLTKEKEDRLRNNIKVFQTTINQLEKEFILTELSYPETINYELIGVKYSIDYKVEIRNLKSYIKTANRILSIKAKDSGIIKERKDKLEKHLIKLRKLRSKRDSPKN